MKVLVLLLLVGVALAKHEEYAGWKSYYVGPQNFAQLKNISSFAHKYDLDFLSRPIVGREGVVLVPPQQQSIFTKTAESWGIPYRVHVEDVVQALRHDDEVMEEAKRRSPPREKGKMYYDNYQTLEVIYDYIDEIARKYPNVVTLVEPQKSYRGRPIKYLKISTTNFQDLSKPVIFIDATIHAREWIVPPTMTWAIHKLVENVTEPDLLDRFDWILLPIVNPDGYSYSHTTNRMWRKTRSVGTAPLSILCPGVDGNRNYDIVWNTIGTGSSPCAEDYPGTRPFSEVETRVVRDILREHVSRIALYLTMHSFGSMILYPWSDGSVSHNELALHSVGVAMADKIFEHSLPGFPKYTVGNSMYVIGYPTSGSSEDYAHSIGVPLTYTYELPGLESDYEGFNLDPRYIAHVVRETWEGIVVGARRAGDLFVPLP